MHANAARAALATLLATAAAPGQPSDIDPVNKWSWGENVGWMDWRDAGQPSASQGVFADPSPGAPSVLSGYIWCENVGWLFVGDGSPADGVNYSATLGQDSGVNVRAGGDLWGLAWGENVGWVNFDTAPTLGASGRQARYDHAARRFRGWAWGENIGWVDLDDAVHHAALACPADFNDDGFLDFFDYGDYVDCFENGVCPPGRSADFNADGFADFFDYGDFVAAFETGC